MKPTTWPILTWRVTWPITWPTACLALLTGLLGLSSVSNIATGAAWLLLVVMGLASALSARPLGASAPNTLFHQLAWTWLIVNACALVVKGSATFYWHDSWQERHAELRLFIGALGLYGLSRTAQWLSADYLSKLQRWATHGLAVSGWVALPLMYLDFSFKLPTNAIPWAVDMSFVSIWLFAQALLRPTLGRLTRLFWGLGGFSVVLAVLVSGKRGAFGLLLVATALAVWTGMAAWQRRDKQSPRRFMPARWMGAAALLSMALTMAYPSRIVQQPLASIQAAVTEYQQTQAGQKEAANTSFGARLYMWQRTIPAIQASPWVGYGQVQRRSMIHQWGEDQNSNEVKVLGHVHNQYLHDMLDHGLAGLTVALLYLLGLAWLTWQLARHQKAIAAWTLGGITFMHLSASLSNVNFAHNYYSAMLALMIALVLLTSAVSESHVDH